MRLTRREELIRRFDLSYRAHRILHKCEQLKTFTIFTGCSFGMCVVSLVITLSLCFALIPSVCHVTNCRAPKLNYLYCSLFVLFAMSCYPLIIYQQQPPHSPMQQQISLVNNQLLFLSILSFFFIVCIFGFHFFIS